MNIDDIPFPPYLACRIKLQDPAVPINEGMVRIQTALVRGEFRVLLDGVSIDAAPINRADEDKIVQAASCGRAYLCWLRDIGKDMSAEIIIYLFNGDVVDMGDVDIGIDEQALVSAQRALGTRQTSIDAITQQLKEVFVFDGGGSNPDDYFFFTTGPASDRVFEEEEDGPIPRKRQKARDKETSKESGIEEQAEESEAVPRHLRAFGMQGRGIRLAVSRKWKAEGQEIFLTSKITKSRAGQSDSALRLGRGKLIFSDYTKTGPMRTLAAGQVEKLIRQKGSYLAAWDKYGALEGDILLKHARDIGALRVKKSELEGGSLVLFFDEDLPQALQLTDEVELVTEEPPHISDGEMTWDQFCQDLEQQEKRKNYFKQEKKKDRDKQKLLSAKVIEIKEKSLRVQLEQAPDLDNSNYFVVLSMMGERVQILRRMEARRKVLEGRSSNPLLGLLIEEGADVPDVSRPPKIKPLTHFVSQKLFPNHPPTDTQIEAIRVALNTPDIALIQGPPGTGKTTVITAILDRLNEEADKRSNTRGEVLITGFQHDAVENVIQRITLNSLPVPKFGNRQASSGDAELHSDRVRVWCSDFVSRMRKARPDLQISDMERSLVISLQHYVMAPSIDLARHLIDQSLNLPRDVIGGDVAAQLGIVKRLIDDEDHQSYHAPDAQLRAARALRVTSSGFSDDGPARAADVLAVLAHVLSDNEAELLKRAVLCRGDQAFKELSDMRKLRRQLLERITPRPIFRNGKPRQDVLDVMKSVHGRVREHGLGAKDKSSKILSDFLSSMESDHLALQHAIADYSYAFAATCQQSAGTQITAEKELLGDDDPSQANTYETVIVDEAARVGPRDLLIPMAKAKRRIILVGDHRQLPHLIDDAVARALETDRGEIPGIGEKSESDLIGQSMFQYLFKRLEQLERQDGIKRRVTLDQQFRMHPLLGNFVSDHFYAEYGESFDSSLSEENFEQDLPGTNGKAAMWVDLPKSAGKTTKYGVSWIRDAEINKITQILREWMNSPQAESMSFGVISFYKAQSERIKAQLAKDGFTVRNAGGSYDIAPQYKHLPAEEGKLPEERLRIGTVDSFQGMEFDVVILSMVRSSGAIRPTAEAKGNMKLGRKNFGHLMSANRLCVSMSRQKRLLVVVGDAAMASCDVGKQCVPGLAGFYELSKSEGVVV